MSIFFVPAAPAMPRAAAAPARLSWGRVAAAGILLVVILGAGLYAGTVPALDAWNKALLNAFEVLLGVFVGVVGGEAAANS